jgi:hypothetical protein
MQQLQPRRTILKPPTPCQPLPLAHCTTVQWHSSATLDTSPWEWPRSRWVHWVLVPCLQLVDGVYCSALRVEGLAGRLGRIREPAISHSATASRRAQKRGLLRERKVMGMRSTNQSSSVYAEKSSDFCFILRRMLA